MTIPKPKNSSSWRDSYYHRLFGLKAAKEAERILPLFQEERPTDDRPRKAIEAIRAWALGKRKLGMSEVRKLSLGAHAAAREAVSDVAKLAAHAAGQAVGTWHVPTHALGAFGYAGKAIGLKRKESRPMKRERSEEEMYHELLYYTLAHSSPAFIHQHAVDAYAAQTADKNTKPITLAFGLIGLYLHVEKKCSGKEVQRAHMRLAKYRQPWPKFDIPKQRGSITVSDVVAAPPGPQRDALIDKWCASVWETYPESHKKVADIVKTQLPEYKAHKEFGAK